MTVLPCGVAGSHWLGSVYSGGPQVQGSGAGLTFPPHTRVRSQDSLPTCDGWQGLCQAVPADWAPMGHRICKLWACCRPPSPAAHLRVRLQGGRHWGRVGMQITGRAWPIGGCSAAGAGVTMEPPSSPTRLWSLGASPAPEHTMGLPDRPAPSGSSLTLQSLSLHPLHFHMH